MAKITIDFGCDFVREYTTTDDIDQKLRQGEMLKLEAMHPRHAEHMKISTGEILPVKRMTATEVKLRHTQAFIDAYNEGRDIGDSNA